jgi:hypothetical protein
MNDKKVILYKARIEEERILLADKYGKPLIVAATPKVGFDPNRIKSA